MVSQPRVAPRLVKLALSPPRADLGLSLRDGKMMFGVSAPDNHRFSVLRSGDQWAPHGASTSEVVRCAKAAAGSTPVRAEARHHCDFRGPLGWFAACSQNDASAIRFVLAVIATDAEECDFMVTEEGVTYVAKAKTVHDSGRQLILRASGDVRQPQFR